ncbi:hypothetical protein TNCV_1646561 [Trichonephila clavipes]|nr:hypothetical protein TNCV_1646561 [Trichonephila clavipes]
MSYCVTIDGTCLRKEPAASEEFWKNCYKERIGDVVRKVDVFERDFFNLCIREKPVRVIVRSASLGRLRDCGPCTEVC